MKTTKNLGIWMDHSTAHLMEVTLDPMETKIIGSKFTHEEKVNTLEKSEHVMHNKEQHQQSEYYKKLGDAFRNYDDVILFGPTNAKVELFNVLRADHRFEKTKLRSGRRIRCRNPSNMPLSGNIFQNSDLFIDGLMTLLGRRSTFI